MNQAQLASCFNSISKIVHRHGVNYNDGYWSDCKEKHGLMMGDKVVIASTFGQKKTIVCHEDAFLYLVIRFVDGSFHEMRGDFDPLLSATNEKLEGRLINMTLFFNGYEVFV